MVGAGAAAGMIAWWNGRHVGRRRGQRRDLWSEAVCDRCGNPLGAWRQLPVIGRDFGGCRSCGHRGPEGETMGEWCAAVAGGVGTWSGWMIGPGWGLAAGWLLVVVLWFAGCSTGRTRGLLQRSKEG